MNVLLHWGTWIVRHLIWNPSRWKWHQICHIKWQDFQALKLKQCFGCWTTGWVQALVGQTVLLCLINALLCHVCYYLLYLYLQFKFWSKRQPHCKALQSEIFWRHLWNLVESCGLVDSGGHNTLITGSWGKCPGRDTRTCHRCQLVVSHRFLLSL